ncbi:MULTISPECIES: c-type cytochrome [unclassified Moraxella]|uniref:c-type cytochrome n=1 Tax=unclassified Moraxella TaxID=2685852 RepID=UPI003AF7181F
MKKLITAASLLLASVSGSAAIAVPKHDVAAGKAIAETICGACHGVNGVSVVPAQPNLGGQNVKYLYKQLTAFKSGDRQNAIMSAQVAKLSDQDLANVAGYYASQPRWSVGYANPAYAQTAQKLYFGGDSKRGVIPCSGCHGGKGNGNDFAAFPRLGGQHSAYIATQLKLFRAAGREDEVTDPNQLRTNDSAKKGEKGMMQIVAAKLSDNDIKVLSDFISAIH